MADNEPDRYDRLIMEWGPAAQKKISDAMITIITDGQLGKYIGSYLASAGFGNIRFVGSSKLGRGEKYLWGIPLRDEYRCHAYADALKKLNPEVETIGIRSDLESIFIRDQLKRSDVLVDATNSPVSKQWTLDTAAGFSIPALSASVHKRYAKLQSFDPKYSTGTDLEEILSFRMQEFRGYAQEELVSMAWAGPVCEEIKKFILDEEKILEEQLSYNFPKRPNKKMFRRKSALVVGAGAAGNKIIPGLAKLGFGTVHFIDNDPEIETSNYPRTEYLINNVGRHKTEVMLEMMTKIFPNTRFKGFFSSFDSSFESGHAYDIVIDVVDNDYARGEIYKYAMKHRILHLSVGTEFYGWNSALAVPHMTACMEHFYPGFMDDAKKSRAILGDGCERTLSSNSWMQSGAVFGLLDIPTGLFPEIAGNARNISRYYDNSIRKRIVEIRSPEVCGCWGEKQ